MNGGTLALSWGRYGGFYVTRRRVCLGWFALTWLNVELDDLMRAYADAPAGAALDRHTQGDVT